MSLHKSRSYKPNLSPPKKVNTDPLVTKFEQDWKTDMIRTIGEPVIRYQGHIDPNSKKRQGNGKYFYQNEYYSYEGDWQDGKKHGRGKLIMKDNLTYEGDFEEGEITGEGIMTWANKNVYKGQFLNGEKHGQGHFITNFGEIYEGEFRHNLRHGKGILRSDNMIIEGYFFNNKPHGFVNISFSTGDRYEGNVNMGIKEGRGVLKSKERWIFDGEWRNDMKHGLGRIIFQDLGYEYEGEYDSDKQKIYGNVIKISGKVQNSLQASIDPEPKGAQSTKNNTLSTQNDVEVKNNITYEINGPLLDIEISIMYQAPEYKDPIQPSKEEIEEMIKQAQKDAKKTKKVVNPDDFYKPRMILPPLYLLTNESGRVLEAVLVVDNVPGINEPGKTIRVDYRQAIKEAKEKQAQQKAEWERQQQELKEQEATAAAASNDPKAKKKPPPKKAAVVQQPIDDVVKLFDINEPEQNKPITLVTRQGKAVLEGFELPEDFPPGTYKLQIRDKTDQKAAAPINLTEIEFQVLGVGGAVDDKKKKKK